MDNWSKWKISSELEVEIRKRDRKCVYCGKEFSGDETIEHIDNNENNITFENIALCCNSCNASKGKKDLREWIENSEYCKSKGITCSSVAEIIKKNLEK